MFPFERGKPRILAMLIAYVLDFYARARRCLLLLRYMEGRTRVGDVNNCLVSESWVMSNLLVNSL